MLPSASELREILNGKESMIEALSREKSELCGQVEASEIELQNVVRKIILFHRQLII